MAVTLINTNATPVFVGLAADTKPPANKVEAGSRFIEADSGKTYESDGANWYAVAGTTATAAKQDTEITAEQAIQAGEGATADAAQQDPTQTASLIALVKGWMQLIGGLADAVVAAGAAGSISAKLRAISRDIVANIVLAAGENHVGEVGGNSAIIKPTCTVTANSAYAAGNVVGGVLTLTAAVRKNNGTGLLNGLFIYDADHQNVVFDIFIFNQNPSNGTYTDKTAFSLNATDAGFLVRRVSVAVTDYVTENAKGFGDPAAINKAVAAAGGQANLYAIMVINTGTPTWTNTANLVPQFDFLRD